MKYQYLGQNPSFIHFKWVYADREHNPIRPYCPDAFHQIWSVSLRYLCRCFGENEGLRKKARDPPFWGRYSHEHNLRLGHGSDASWRVWTGSVWWFLRRFLNKIPIFGAKPSFDLIYRGHFQMRSTTTWDLAVLMHRTKFGPYQSGSFWGEDVFVKC